VGCSAEKGFAAGTELRNSALVFLLCTSGLSHGLMNEIVRENSRILGGAISVLDTALQLAAVMRPYAVRHCGFPRRQRDNIASAPIFGYQRMVATERGTKVLPMSSE
jgi:hypothetical protein